MNARCERALRDRAQRRRFSALLSCLAVVAAFASESELPRDTSAAPSVAANAPARGSTAPSGEMQKPKSTPELLVDFARYASWPAPRRRGNLVICMAGNPLPLLDTTAAAQAQVKGFQSIEFIEVEAPIGSERCHVLWLAANVRPSPRAWIQSLPRADILTLSDHADFALDGGIVSAWQSQGDWRFEINMEALQRSGILLSASVLRLSRKVR